MSDPKPTAEQLEAERLQREEDVFQTASVNAQLVQRAGITNGMPPDQVRARILAIAAPGGVK